jgi:cytochrome d ubiquinol oxidase subunit II
MATAVVSIFVALYPNVMVSSTNAAYNLTVSNSSSAKYALTVMTVVAVLFLPLVLLYQGWSYHVFRSRIGRGNAPADPQAPPAAQATTEPTG